MRVERIARVHAPSAAEFRRSFRDPGRPVVITGAIDDWAALDWTVDALAHRAGARSVPVRIAHHPAQRFDGDEQRTFSRTQMPLAELVSRLPEGARYYLQAAKLPRDLPELALDVRRPPYCPRLHVSPPLLFVNGPGAIAPAHYDYNHVLMAGVVGQKRYLLVAPEDSAKLADRITRTLWRTSRVDLAHPDAETHRALEDVTLHEHVLGPGELLFIPYRWWHHMDASMVSISVSWWWQPSTLHRIRDELFYLALHPLRLAARSPAMAPRPGG